MYRNLQPHRAVLPAIARHLVILGTNHRQRRDSNMASVTVQMPKKTLENPIGVGYATVTERTLYF